jgi:hypothetical protein
LESGSLASNQSRPRVLGTAKLNGIDPESYLRNVLSRIADHPIKCIEDLLPWNVAKNMQPRYTRRPR